MDTTLKTSRHSLSPPPLHRCLLGDSLPMHNLRKQIDQLAHSLAPVYISGESGSGKELVARLIHDQGPRAGQRFVPINCGAIPAELMESEFFGHCKGSFSGAIEDKRGLFHAANAGTLFLDEVADLPAHMQVKLLRAIQEKAVRRVGEQHETAIDTRILCATHKSLDGEVLAGRFRQDLYYRLNVIEVRVPPLRERREDIELLAGRVLQRLARDSGRPLAWLQPQALKVLKDYGFPGNVRELENILERAHTLCENTRIEVSDLRMGQSHSPTGLRITDIDKIDDLQQYLESIERQVLLQTLEETRWNRTAAAQRLSLSFRSMRYRLKKLGLD